MGFNIDTTLLYLVPEIRDGVQNFMMIQSTRYK